MFNVRASEGSDNTLRILLEYGPLAGRSLAIVMTGRNNLPSALPTQTQAEGLRSCDTEVVWAMTRPTMEMII